VIWVQKRKVNVQYVWARVFAGADEDQLALTGMLCLVPEEYDELVELIMDGGFRQAKKAQEAGTPSRCSPPVVGTRAPPNATTAIRGKRRWWQRPKKPVAHQEPCRQSYSTILTMPKEVD
jgi:hypothetical protein